MAETIYYDKKIPDTMYLAHRVNVLSKELAEDIFSRCCGIEFDIRDSAGELIVVHDAFMTDYYQTFSEFLTFCRPDKFYIVNVKAEGIEQRAIHMLEAAGIRNFFLLDVGIPAMMRLHKTGETRFAIRYSEVEPMENVDALKHIGTWVWVDCFTKYSLTREVAQTFKSWGLKICLVSPDLQGRPDEIAEYIEILVSQNIPYDAVCCKLWNKMIWTHIP